MITMLLHDTNQDNIPFVQKHLIYLFQMNSKIVFKFIDECCSKYLFHIQGQLYQDVAYIHKQTQYINQNTIKEKLQDQIDNNTSSILKIITFGRQQLFARYFSIISLPIYNSIKKLICCNKVKVITNNKTTPYFNDIEQEALSDEENVPQKKNRVCQCKRKKVAAPIKFYSYEFDKIFKGSKGNKIIKYLNRQSLHSPLFQLSTIQAYLDSQWQIFKWKYYMIIILYLIGFGLMIPYFELYKNAVRDGNKVKILQLFGRNWFFFNLLFPFQVSLSLYLTFYEFNKLAMNKNLLQIITCFYNIVQMLMPIFVLIIYTFDSEDVWFYPEIWIAIQYGLNAIFIILGMIVLLYKIKYLNFASFFIARFYYVIKEIYILGLIILAIQVFFAYAYKIIYDINHEKREGLGIAYKASTFIFEDTYTQLWQFYQDRIMNPATEPIAYTQNICIIVFLSIFTVIVLSTNMLLTYYLIAAIVEKYNRATRDLLNQEYHSRAKILYQNDFLFKRHKSLKETRFVIKVEKESVKDDESSELLSVRDSLQFSMKLTTAQEARKTEENVKNVRGKVSYVNEQLLAMHRKNELNQMNLKSQIANVEQLVRDRNAEDQIGPMNLLVTKQNIKKWT